MTRLIQIGILLIVGLVVVYGAIVIYGQFQPTKGSYLLPDKNEAQYSVRIKNTGLTLFSDDVEVADNIVRMKGFWELIDEKYKYRDANVVLDKTIFGPVTVRKRQ